MQTGLIFNNTYYSDNGLYNDSVALDGIFTSELIFEHTPDMPYEVSQPIRSFMDQPIVNYIFEHQEDLSIYYSTYPYNPDPNALPKFGIECDIVFGTSGCNAEKWGWCERCCFTLKNCKVTIGI